MRFLFNMMNHGLLGQRSLEDVIGIMAHQLRALGHEAQWVPENDKLFPQEQGINIIVEGFTPEIVEVLRHEHGRGARYLILATEEPTPKGFNHGTSREMVMRQEVFPRAAELCEGIVHLVPGQHVTDWYSQFAPAAQAELGYARTLVRFSSSNDYRVDEREAEFDFGFYGSMSYRRAKILKRLARKMRTDKTVLVEGDFTSQEDRDRKMRRAKVLVQIRKFEQMGLVSSSRCATALLLGRPVIAEPHELSKPWDRIVRFSATPESFYDEAIMVRANWRGVHAQQFDRFREVLTPEFCVGAPLRKIGILRNVDEPSRRVA